MQKQSEYEKLAVRLERAMAYQAALILFEWDNETLAPEQAGPYTAKVQGNLSAAYQEIMTSEETRELISRCEEAAGQESAAGCEQVMEQEGAARREQKAAQSGATLTPVQCAIVREAREESDQLSCIPPEEYRAYQELVAESTRVWVNARKNQDFDAFAPTLEKIIDYQKRFAGYKAKDGQKLYDVMLDTYEKGFNMKKLDVFFGELKEELVPFLRKVMESPVKIADDFLCGGYSEEKQRKLAEELAKYVGFDFGKGVLAESAHPFTTNLHNHDVRITTHYGERVDSSLFSVIHESGHAVYELGIDEELTQTLVGQGTSMGMHESQSRFFENIIGRNEAFWVPLYERLQGYFPEQLKGVSRDEFVKAVNRVQPGLIRTEADELTYSLHVLVRYELEKMLIEENLDVKELPRLWADKYEEYLGVRPANVAEGVLQDIHWSQGSFGYFPSYALGSAFGAQMYAHMKQQLDFEQLLREGKIEVIREYLREHVHKFGKLKTSREILKDMTGEDFDPRYYVEYLKEKYGKLYGINADCLS